MTIDQAMLGAVRHYLAGNLAKVTLIHDEIEFKGKSINDQYAESKTFAEVTAEVKQLFLEHSEKMLKAPVPLDYSHKENYFLNPEDESFLRELHARSKDADWKNFDDIKKL